MARTQAQEDAIDRELHFRDYVYCMWHRLRPKGKALVLGNEMHHMARRQPGGDVEELIYPLCSECHRNHHNGKEPHTYQLLDVIEKDYRLNLREKYPYFFGKH